MILGIIGAGELGQQIANIATFTNAFSKIVFFDDIIDSEHVTPQGKVIGKTSSIEAHFKKGHFDKLFIGIGYKHMPERKQFFDMFKNKIPFATIIHPTSFVDPSSKIGEGSVLYPGCIIDKNCVVGNNVLINIGSFLCHDSIIGDHTFLGPGTKLAGFVNIGTQCFFGIGTICIDNISVCDNVQTAGGSVITKTIITKGLYAGIPAVLKKAF